MSRIFAFILIITFALLASASPRISRRTHDLDYNEVYTAIVAILNETNYDDGSYGPILVRLAWHSSGSYSKEDGTGGSNGATMRFPPESEYAANAGLGVARDRLELIKQQFPEISYGDLWTLAGVVAIQEMGGPVIPWRPGRKDKDSGADCPPDGRLPDASKTQDHIREIFYRMGFDDQETVALIGAHAVGRCHTNRSGYDGHWTNTPTQFTNDFFVEMLNNTWIAKNWTGPMQFVNQDGTQPLMMLPADLALDHDNTFHAYVALYAQSQDKFFEDFAKAFQKLLELGVPFDDDEEVYTFSKSTS